MLSIAAAQVMYVVLFIRQGYMDFQEAGNSYGLLHSFGRMFTAES